MGTRRASLLIFSVVVITIVTASAEAQSLPYLGGGYRIATGSHDPRPDDWAQTQYNDQGWTEIAQGAAVGSGPRQCPLAGDGHWPLDQDLLVRQWVNLYPNVTRVEVGFAFDNDIVAVFWNGVRVQGEVRHEGCATRDSLVIQIPAQLIRAGQPNLLAVHVRDRGVISYYDHRITAQ